MYDHDFCFQEKENWNLGYNKWGDDLHKFNSSESKAEVKSKSVEEITPECSIPEITLLKIPKHIQTFYSEQRWYRKNKKLASPKVCVLHKLLRIVVFSIT